MPNAYASKICAGKIKDPSGVKRKDFRGPKPSKAMGGRIFKQEGGSVKSRETLKKISKAAGKLGPAGLAMDAAKKIKKTIKKSKDMPPKIKRGPLRRKMMGGGMMRMPRAMYNKGGSTGKIPTTPKEKEFAALAPPKDRITYSDKIAGATGRTMARGGGLMEATSRLRAQGLKMGGIARGCGAVMSDRRKKTKMY